MKSQLKKYMIFLMFAIIIMMPSLSYAQILPQVRLTAPTSMQAEVGKEFAIPLTITMGNQEDIVGTVRPIIDKTGIRIEERAINQILAPNASINLALTGIAQTTGLFRVILEVVAAGFIYSTEVMVDVEDPDEAEKRARFSITQAKLTPGMPESDMPFTLTIDIKNTGSKPSGLVSATIAGLGNFSVQSITNRADTPSVASGETGKISFILKETEERKSSEVSLTLNYDDYTQTESLFLPLPEVNIASPPFLKIESFEIKPAQEGQFTLELTVVNKGQSAAENVSVSLDAGGKAFPLSGGVVRTIDELAPFATAKVSYLFSSQGELSAHPVNIAFEFQDENNTLRKGSDRIFISTNLEPSLRVANFDASSADEAGDFSLALEFENIGLSKARDIKVRFTGNQANPLNGSALVPLADIPAGGSGKLSLLMRAATDSETYIIPFEITYLSQGGAEHTVHDSVTVTIDVKPSLHVASFNARAAGEEGDFTLALEFKNTGLKAAREIKIRFTGNQAVPLNRSALVSLTDIVAGGSGNLSLLMRTTLDSETYVIPFEITYRSQGGAEHKVNDSVTVTADSIGVKFEKLPVIMLDRHTLSEEAAYTGSTFTLTLFVRNTSNNPKDNAKITFGEARAGNTGGSVFISPDGRTSFHAETIPANAEIKKEITLLTDRNAQAMNYSLPVTIEYEDGKGEVSVVNASITIPVRHEGRFRILNLDLAQSATVGEAVPVSMEFANTGRVNLENMFISLEGDFEKENATFFIPSFESATSDFFHATLFPQTEGELTGTIVVTYDDTDGSEIRIEHPFAIDVSSAALPEAGIPGNPEQDYAFPFLMYGAIFAGLAVLIAIFIIKRSKAKRIAMS